MSLHVMVAVLDAEGLTPNEKIVAIAYADHAHHDGTEARAGLDRIARKSALSRRTVNGVIKSLLAKKVMVVQKEATNKTPVCYRFLLTEDGKTLLHFRPANPAPQESSGGANNTSRGADPAPRGADVCTQTNEPSEEPFSSPEGEQSEYPSKFDELWNVYPRREGKKAAWRKVSALLRKNVRYEQLMEATANYALECISRETKHIKLASTFFGPDDHWRERVANISPPVYSPNDGWDEELKRRREESAPPPTGFAAKVRKQLEEPT